MIDLTPIDVRKKAGDFKKGMLGYDTKEVEDFLSLAADRLEELVKENGALGKQVAALEERAERLQEQLSVHEERQKAVQEALIMAQKLREDVRAQAERDAAEAREQAQAEIKKSTVAAQRGLEDARRRLGELALRRKVFLQSFRGFLEKELEKVQTEEGELARSAAEGEMEPQDPSDRPTVPESVREEVLAALESSMPQDAQPASSSPAQAASSSPAPDAAGATEERTNPGRSSEDPWVSALQNVEPFSKKREAGPSN